MNSISVLRSAGIHLPLVQTSPPAPWPDGGPKSLRAPRCGLAIRKKQAKPNQPMPDTECTISLVKAMLFNLIIMSGSAHRQNVWTTAVLRALDAVGARKPVPMQITLIGTLT
ncbi:hypothetical protein PoB_005467400 [Plakobranchus ocellatus]|uniref:Uncharacterized protein n=1 Tax=Plakobranchus ocellatus TaxID=259542 RepID=A0AAV4CBV1_9GAST|nr:hypothetical protein PoB_005467400 [Plakobranchus ocellatus]